MRAKKLITYPIICYNSNNMSETYDAPANTGPNLLRVAAIYVASEDGGQVESVNLIRIGAEPDEAETPQADDSGADYETDEEATPVFHLLLTESEIMAASLPAAYAACRVVVEGGSITECVGREIHLGNLAVWGIESQFLGFRPGERLNVSASEVDEPPAMHFGLWAEILSPGEIEVDTMVEVLDRQPIDDGLARILEDEG